MRTSSFRRAALLLAAAVIGVSFAVFTSPASAVTAQATARLVNASGVEVGKVVFKGVDGYADRVEVELNAPAAPNLGKFHGFHVHTTGECVAPFTSAGGHWNPTGAVHGDHAGDLPSPLVAANGKSYAEFETDRFDVSQLFDLDGSAVILHAGADNFANIPPVYGAPNATTLATGDAGARYACGLVKRV